MSSGAPWATKVSSTWAMRLSWVPVVSLPSEKVPAPPSPNWTLEVREQLPGAPETLHVGGPLVHRPPPLQHDGGHPGPGQGEGGEQPRRPHAHHHGGVGEGPGRGGQDIGPLLQRGEVL